MSVFNTTYLAEAAENEYKLQIDSESEGIATAIAKEFKQIEELEKDVFEYRAPMIPLVQKATQEGTKYIVEFDMLNKLAKDQKQDVYSAFTSVCEANNVEANDVYVYLRGNITECVTEAVNESNIKSVRKALDAIRILKENDVNLVREIIDEDENLDEPEGVEVPKIPTDPKDDTINTLQDYEDAKTVNGIKDTSQAIAGE